MDADDAALLNLSEHVITLEHPDLTFLRWYITVAGHWRRRMSRAWLPYQCFCFICSTFFLAFTDFTAIFGANTQSVNDAFRRTPLRVSSSPILIVASTALNAFSPISFCIVFWALNRHLTIWEIFCRSPGPSFQDVRCHINHAMTLLLCITYAEKPTTGTAVTRSREELRPSHANSAASIAIGARHVDGRRAQNASHAANADVDDHRIDINADFAATAGSSRHLAPSSHVPSPTEASALLTSTLPSHGDNSVPEVLMRRPAPAASGSGEGLSGDGTHRTLATLLISRLALRDCNASTLRAAPLGATAAPHPPQYAVAVTGSWERLDNDWYDSVRQRLLPPVTRRNALDVFVKMAKRFVAVFLLLHLACTVLLTWWQTTETRASWIAAVAYFPVSFLWSAPMYILTLIFSLCAMIHSMQLNDVLWELQHAPSIPWTELRRYLAGVHSEMEDTSRNFRVYFLIIGPLCLLSIESAMFKAMIDSSSVAIKEAFTGRLIWAGVTLTMLLIAFMWSLMLGAKLTGQCQDIMWTVNAQLLIARSKAESEEILRTYAYLTNRGLGFPLIRGTNVTWRLVFGLIYALVTITIVQIQHIGF